MISGYLIGDREMVAKLSAMPAAVHDEVLKTVTTLQQRLIAEVVGNKLAGQVLKRRTGKLAGSIPINAPETRSRMEDDGIRIIAYVGTNVSYGIGWEYGFDRKVGAGARGGPRTLTGKARETYFAKHPPGVKHMAARPFLAPALQEMKPLITRELTDALTRAMQKALK